MSVAAAGAVFSSMPAIAAQAVEDAAPPAVEPAKEPAKEKRICRREESSMGSRMSGKICKPAAEWKAETDRSRRAIEDRDKD
ncbi:hypothetical protein [Tsuneonella dongtanensis]|uniref:hypothetical protein n=1 Tax=Tsuneonella dongtanensis TaxID=692370 RepID=UPI00083721B3|nr:hypothetical protein [Tsuneonella dongtanensis]